MDEAAEAEGHWNRSTWARDGLLRLTEEVQFMKRKSTAEEPIFGEAPEEDLTDLEVVSSGPQPKISTLSFPVRGEPVYEPVYDTPM